MYHCVTVSYLAVLKKCMAALYHYKKWTRLIHEWRLHVTYHGTFTEPYAQAIRPLTLKYLANKVVWNDFGANSIRVCWFRWHNIYTWFEQWVPLSCIIGFVCCFNIYYICQTYSGVSVVNILEIRIFTVIWPLLLHLRHYVHISLFWNQLSMSLCW